MRPVLLGALASALCFGCATAQQTPDSEHVGLRAAATTGVQANLSGDGLFGPDVSVRRVPHGYRGTTLGRVVDIDFAQQDKVEGVFGSGPVSLKWAPDDGGLRIRGLFGGQISNLLITPEKIDGTMGDCTYQMARDGALYRGFQRCLGITQRDSVLELPPDVVEKPLNERVALFSLVLGTYRSAADPVTRSDMAPPPPPRHWKNVNGVYELRHP